MAQAAWIRPESYAFADSVLRGLWCRQLEARQEARLRVDFAARQSLDAAMLWWTCDTGATGDRKWHSQARCCALVGRIGVLKRLFRTMPLATLSMSNRVG